MHPIGLIAAMNQECQPLLRGVNGWEKYRTGRFTCYRFRLDDQDCVLIQSGIGLERASEATHTLVATVHPQLLVSFGVAGAVHDDLKIGDVVYIRSTILLDNGAAGPSMRLAELSGPAWQAVAAALQPGGAQIVMGTAFTTPGSQSVPGESPVIENPVLEMETFAIAQAAAEHAIPLLALRAISDNPSYPLPIDPDTVMDENYHLRPGKLILSLIRHPEIILKANRMRRNTAMAAENAAIAVIAALSYCIPDRESL
jgi:adenosylhomocysteine nucleosidase